MHGDVMAEEGGVRRARWVPRPPANVAYLSMYLRGRVRTQRITSGLANFVAWTFARLCKKNKSLFTTLAAERQDPDFLIGPRNEKQRKKRSAVKILHSLLQITSCHF
jgi:hypothetical protein